MSLLSSEHVYNHVSPRRTHENYKSVERTKNHYKIFGDPYLRNGSTDRLQILAGCQHGRGLRFDTGLTSIRLLVFELGKGPPHFRPPLTPQWVEISSRRLRNSRRTALPNAPAKFGEPGSIGSASFWGSKFRASAALRHTGIPVPGGRASRIYCLHTTQQSHAPSIADGRRQPSECSLAMPISLGNLRRTHANSVHNGALWETSNPRNSGTA